MTHNHLTDRQLFDLLTARGEAVILSEGPRQPDAVESSPDAHLTACPRCQSELTTLRASLTNLRLATTSLAAAGTPPHAPRLATPRRTSIFFRPAWAVSFATAAALCVATLTYVHPIHNPKVHDNPTQPASSTESAEADDALLNDIQRDLSTNVAPSLAPLSVPTH